MENPKSGALHTMDQRSKSIAPPERDANFNAHFKKKSELIKVTKQQMQGKESLIANTIYRDFMKINPIGTDTQMVK